MNSYRLRAFVFAALWGGLVVANARALLINFNSTSDLGTYFVLNDFDGAWAAPANIASGGLGGSGSVVLSDTYTGAQAGTEVLTSGLPLSSVGSQVTVSMYFQEQPATDPYFYHALQLGILDATTGYIRDGAGTPYAVVNIDSSAANTFNLATKVTGASPNTGSSFALVNDNWYKLDGVFANTGGGNVSITATLYNSDASGNLGTTIATLGPITNSIPALTSAATVYAGFRAYSVSGASHYDNFLFEAPTAIPEPATGLLLGLGVFWLWRKPAGRRRASLASTR